MSRSTIALIAAAFFSLAPATPVLAGSWQPEQAPPPEASPPPYGPMQAVRYVSEKLRPGEVAILAASPLFNGGFGNIYPSDNRPYSSDPEESAFFILLLALNSGGEPITGFDGVSMATLGPDNRAREEIALYSLSGPQGRSNPEAKCGEHVRLWDFGGPFCRHECFVSRDDLEGRRNAVPCAGGSAYWIAIEVVRAIGGNRRFRRPDAPSDPSNRRLQQIHGQQLKAYEAQGREMDAAMARGEPGWLFSSQVANSKRLLIKVRHGKSVSMHLDLDDNFRRTIYRQP